TEAHLRLPGRLRARARLAREQANKRHRTLWPVVRERAAQVTLLQSLLRDLGLERRARDVDLAAQLAALHRPGSPPPGGDRAEPPPSPGDGGDATPARDAGDGGNEP